MDSPAEEKKCHLLQLPGELRNRIYRYALVTDDDIDVTSTGPGEPALLLSSKDIRQESLLIYYRENHFNMRVPDWNGTALVPFMKQLRKIGEPVSESFQTPGSPNGDNMVCIERRKSQCCLSLRKADFGDPCGVAAICDIG